MGELNDLVKKRSPFLRLESGESVLATYQGFKLIPSTYDPDKEIFRFILTVKIEGEDTQKYWDTGSNKVAMVFDTLQKGDKVTITKNVDNPGSVKEKTRWEVTAVGFKKQPEEEREDQEERDTQEPDVSEEDMDMIAKETA